MNIQKLTPAYKDYLWGGNKLKEKYGKTTDLSPLAESWELSFHKDGECLFENEIPISKSVSERALGKNLSDFPLFPVMIKFIDAAKDLSIQVHPNDDYALLHENSLGKTEMWYVVEAEEGAGIYLGFNRDVTKEEYRQAIAENRITELLNFYKVKAGECYFIPAGTVHAIGAGCLICEIQQNSNVTYRVYDYGRLGKDGKARELHIEKALDVSELKMFTPRKADALLGASRYFTAREITVSDDAELCADEGSFHCVTCVSGTGYTERKKISLGDSFFIPAGYGSYALRGDMTVILTEIRKYRIVSSDDGSERLLLIDDLGRIVASGANRSSLLSSVNMTESDVEL